MSGKNEYYEHPFEPVWNKQSRILILGTFPSPLSRENGFYYGHPRNRFWKTLATILNTTEPANDKNSKAAFLLSHKIAVWDVLKSCKIMGASDSSILDPVPNDFRKIIKCSDIYAIFTTGKKATGLFNALSATETGMMATYLPSTSPANASWDKNKCFEIWKAEIEKSLFAKNI